MEGSRNIMQRGGTHLINIPFNAYNDQGLALCLEMYLVVQI